MEMMESLLSLDDDMREKVVSTFSFQRHMERAAVISKLFVQEIKDSVIVTGSIAEGMASARLFKVKQNGPTLQGEIEADIMFHIMVLDARGQEELLKPIPDKLGYFKVKKPILWKEHMPGFLGDLFTSVFEDFSKMYISGTTIKETIEEQFNYFKIHPADSEMQTILKVVAQLGMEEVEVTTGSNSEVNGPAVTISLQLGSKDGARILMEVDAVPCIQLPTWPVGQEAFLTRHRESGYPTPDQLSELIHAGIHIVPKMTSSSCDPEEWRLSFSVAEKKLADRRNHGQRLTYMMFKSMYYAHIKSIEIQNTTLPSYFAKTIMMWSMEEIPERKWTIENMENNLQLMFGKLSECLSPRVRCLKHYFIPDVNLLDPYKHDQSDLLDAAAAKMNEISQNARLFFASAEKIENVSGQIKVFIKNFWKISNYLDLIKIGEDIGANVMTPVVQNLVHVYPEAVEQVANMISAPFLRLRNLFESNTTRVNFDTITSAIEGDDGIDLINQSIDRGNYQEDELD